MTCTVDDIMTLIKIGASEESIRKMIETTIRIREIDAHMAGYREGHDTVMKIFTEEMKV